MHRPERKNRGPAGPEQTPSVMLALLHLDMRFSVSRTYTMPQHSIDNVARQSRRLREWMMPNIAVGVFVVAMIALVWMLEKRDFDQQMAALARDVQWAEQTLRLNMQGDQEFLQRLARDASQDLFAEPYFRNRTRHYLAVNPHLTGIAWLDADDKLRSAANAEGENDEARDLLAPAKTTGGLAAAHKSELPVYGSVYQSKRYGASLEMFVPVRRGDQYLGTMVAVYSVPGMLRHLIPASFSEKYHLRAIGTDQRLLGENASARPGDETLNYEFKPDPPGNGLILRVRAYPTDASLVRSLPTLLIAALSLLVVWSLWSLRGSLAQRARAEDALRAESNFRNAMEESMPTGMRAIDLRGRITYVNAAFCEMVGYAQDELIGARAPYPYWNSNDQTDYESGMLQSPAADTPRQGVEAQFRRKNGELFDARVYEAPLVDASGRQSGWMASIHDVTEQRRARAELEASHQRFMTVLDGLDSAIYVADLDADEILFANRAFKNIYGYDAVGRNCWQVTSACQPDPARFIAAARMLVPHQTPAELYETELQNRLNGHWYQLRERAIQWVDGCVVRMQVATDITDRRKMEDFNRQQMARLQQTSRLTTMGEMASSLAHELNQPLAAIANYNMGCVNRLQANDYRREELLAAMQKASAQAERAGKIIRRVRDFVRKSEPKRDAVDVADAIEEVIGFTEIDARKALVRISVSVAGDLPAAYADKVMVEQVLINLVKNGIEAMLDTPRGGRELAISARANGKDFIEVNVADRGQGVAEDQAEMLFTPFYTTKQEGMGIGLNICRSIIEFHNGRLWTTSNPGGGSVFSFTLPVIGR